MLVIIQIMEYYQSPIKMPDQVGHDKQDSLSAVFFVPRAGLEPARPFRAKGF